VRISQRTSFPRLISPAFVDAVTYALRFSVLAFVVVAGASWLRGTSQRWEDPVPAAAPARGATPAVSR